MFISSTRTLLFASVLVLFSACGGGDDTADTATPDTATTEDVAPDANPDVSYAGPPAEITLSPVGNEMQYEQTEFTVFAGQTVHIIFNNTADNPAMSHNVVVLNSQDAVNAVGQAALTASETDYIPAANESDIIAHTAMSAPGETVEVTFTAPSTVGDYPFICTFPGHYMTMQGTMHVEG